MGRRTATIDGFDTLTSFPSTTAMYGGICICLLLAVLSTSSSGQQPSGSHNANPGITDLEQTLTESLRHARTVASGGPSKTLPQLDGHADSKGNFGAVLAKYFRHAQREFSQ
ncbi:UNVERIFIED_CONTAM: hypothetical protein K2H54_047147 [Gekko kuhli]